MHSSQESVSPTAYSPSHQNEAARLAALGRQLLERQQLAEAQRALEQAVALSPQLPAAWEQLGTLLRQKNDLPRAIHCLRKARQLEPESRATRRELVRLLILEGQYTAADEEFRELISRGGEVIRLLLEYAGWLEDASQYERAEHACRQALALDDRCSPARATLGNVLRLQNRWREAVDCYRRIPAPADDRSRQLWTLWNSAVAPETFDSRQEIEDWREQFRQAVAAIPPGSIRLTPDTVRGQLIPPPYILQFHGEDNRQLKQQFARLFDPGEPALAGPAAADGSGRAAARPKAGLVVIGNGAGIFLRCMSGVLEHFDHDRLELVVVCSAGTRNSLTPHLQNPRLGWHILPDEFSQMVPALAAGRFDVLYHWEVGSGPQNYFLPFFGAAPEQCTGWGLPDTTGIPQLEYYLTSASVEPPGAQTQYSEQLYFSEQLLTWQSRIPAPETPATREEFGISSWQTLYVCAQHVRKLHPDFDEMLAGVLRLDPEGVCLLVQDRTGYGANRVQQRMARTIPDVASRVRWLPRLTVDQYRRLISTADVLLDTPHFGGGLTTFDAFSLGIPVITLPGTFRRSRYASACYRLMGLDCGIADNLQEYITLAVALGRNRDIRESVSRSILARSEVLFENRQVVREFERIFCELAARKPGPA